MGGMKSPAFMNNKNINVGEARSAEPPSIKRMPGATKWKISPEDSRVAIPLRSYEISEKHLHEHIPVFGNLACKYHCDHDGHILPGYQTFGVCGILSHELVLDGTLADVVKGVAAIIVAPTTQGWQEDACILERRHHDTDLAGGMPYR